MTNPNEGVQHDPKAGGGLSLREQIARVIDPREWGLEDFARKTGRSNMWIEPSLKMADQILATLDAPGNQPALPSVDYTAADRQSFIERFERDNAGALPRRAWGEWVNALPRAEFMAMCMLEEDRLAGSSPKTPGAHNGR